MLPLRYNINSILLRRLTSISVIFGIGMFVFIITLILMFRSGIQNTMTQSSSPEDIIILSMGASNEMSSFIRPEKIDRLLSQPQIETKADIREFVIIKLFKRLGQESGGNILIRGVPENVFDFRPEVNISQGRAPLAGQKEVIIGKRVSERFDNMKLGDVIEMGNKQFVEVVGIFEYENSSLESEIWGDIDVIRTMFGREGVISSVRLKLNGEKTTFIQLEDMVRDGGLDLVVFRESDFLNSQATKPKQFVAMIGFFFAVFISIASVIGTSTMMNTSVANRKQEVVMLRNIGFSTRSILLSFLIEPLLLGLIGSILGLLLSLSLTTFKLSIMNVGTWSQLVVGFKMTPETIIYSLIAGAIIGLAGGIFPALKTLKFSHS